ncbi:hypothetical protein E2562_026208 [Oryza meyeriana var. granulata]|uniref:Uncharacterized protein n=1 Tax=Oryza meyeriana var. granulata TaxID=110450 RepID=A0A6G1E2P7_9ORYZ|nr:hypothetical protein E2562_026208 [Oryza meyeriana var. granulata]
MEFGTVQRSLAPNPVRGGDARSSEEGGSRDGHLLASGEGGGRTAGGGGGPTMTILGDKLMGLDSMVHNAKRSMLEELEGMLEIVDPQPPGKPRTLSRRKFDLPEACFFVEMSIVKPPVKEVLQELFIPRLTGPGATGDSIELLGALVMPNLPPKRGLDS